MKKIIALGAAALAVMSVSNSYAQNTSSAPIETYARIVRPIVVHYWDDINFGAVYQSATGGNVVMTPDVSLSQHDASQRSGSAGAIVVNSAGPNNPANIVGDGDDVEMGGISVDGEAGFAYTLTGTGGAMTGPGLGLNVHDITFDWNASAPSASPVSTAFAGNITDNTLASTFYYVGGTLTVPGNATPGYYTGSINVTATYQ